LEVDMTPFRHILVPLDGSELAEKALAPAGQIAAAMAERAGSAGAPVRLVLLRAVSPMALLAADPMLYDEMVRMSVDEAQAYLKTTALTLGQTPFAVESVAVSGSPADAIVQYAEEKGIDLIVMSSHGRTGSSRWVYGSVAEKVMHHAPCATVIIRAHVNVSMFQNKKILVPLDGSELAERALGPALSLAEAVESDVILLRVVAGREPLPEAMTPAGDRVEAALDAAGSQERSEAEAYLRQIQGRHEDSRLATAIEATAGDVADAIISYADGRNVDLIIMSSHGRSGIGRWLHGSVAEKVLRGANCATLIVRQSHS
jgi:nucleotide-binding universal stress UspA family protein